MAIDYTTPEGQIRLLIADVDEAAPLLDDAMLTGFLALAGGNVKLAAAAALEAVASSEVLVSKKIRTQDLATDGPAVAAELRAQAASLRAQAAADADVEDEGVFDVVDTLPSATRPEHTYPIVWGL